MINLTKVISTEIDAIKRRIVKVLRLGRNDVQTPIEGAPFGVDGNPPKDLIAIYAKTGVKGNEVIIGYLNKNQLAGAGELRTYAVDENGDEVFYTWLKNDGSLELGGDVDNLARFSELKAVIEELQNDIGDLKQAFSTWTPVPNDGGAALKTASATWAGTPLAEDVDNAKIDEIKTL